VRVLIGGGESQSKGFDIYGYIEYKNNNLMSENFEIHFFLMSEYDRYRG
jgi:hypothetical protein